MIDSLNLKKITDNVFKYEDSLSVLNPQMIEHIKYIAHTHPMQRARINFHHSDEALVHEMIIAMTNGTIVEPHQHLNKCESFHLMEGTVRIGFINEDGIIMNIVELSKDKTEYYRLNTPDYHIVVPISEMVVIHEVTNGPFLKEENTFNLNLSTKKVNMIRKTIRSWRIE
jgi:cupin fold WbuC family metalloprotein